MASPRPAPVPAAQPSHDVRFIDLSKVGAFVANEWMKKLAANLRQADVDEIAASIGLTPEEAIRLSVHYSSHGYVVLDADREPIAMFGAVPSPVPGAGIMWMLGTDGIKRNARDIARHSRPHLDRLNQTYPYLWNYVDARNVTSRRWLEWAGCRIVGEEPSYGVEKRAFLAFGRSCHL